MTTYKMTDEDYKSNQVFKVPSYATRLEGKYDGMGWPFCKIREIVFPNGLKEIGPWVCRYAKIKNVSFPDSLEIIDVDAFSGSELESIRFPARMRLICPKAFSGCKNLKSVVLPDGLEKLSERSFQGCLNLSEVILPSSLEKIESKALAQTAIQEIAIPESVISIGEKAFYDCSKLKSIVLPEGVTTIEPETFGCCGSLRTVVVTSTIETIHESAFHICHDLVIVLTRPSSFEIIGYTPLKDNWHLANRNVTIVAPAGTTVTKGQEIIPLAEYCRNASDFFSIRADPEISKTSPYRESIKRIIDSTDTGVLCDKVTSMRIADDRLKDYLKAVYESECQVANLESTLGCLYDADARRQACTESSIKYVSVICSEEVEELKRCAQSLRDGTTVPSGIESLGVPPNPIKAPSVLARGERPTAPAAPEFIDMPSEPEYRTPSLFNKKKTERENEKKKTEYIASIERAKKENEERRAIYEREIQAYERMKQEYSEKARQFDAAQNAYEQYLASKQEYERKVELLAIQEAEAIEARADALIESKIEELTSASEACHAFLRQLSDDAEQTLRSAAGTLKSLYALDIVFPKYRNLPAIATIYEYIASGRCCTLEGHDGAYNLYESELRADRAIAKLEDIASSLEQVKANQFMLYKAVEEGNKSLGNLADTVTSVGGTIVAAVNEATRELQDMQPKIDSLQQTAQEVAHNSSVAAYWSRKNAELTDAIGYLIAFDALS